jgi:hypothetical protein
MVTEHEGTDSFDYGCCKFAAGVIALKEGRAVQAEKNLLEAEQVFTLSVGKDSAYLRSVYNGSVVKTKNKVFYNELICM